MFCAYWNDELVGMCAVLPQPGVYNGKAWRVTRLVILPDFQGLGIGKHFLEAIAEMFSKNDKRLYIRTSHIKLINALKKSKDWNGDGKLKHSQPEGGKLKNRKINSERLSASFYYDGLADKYNLDYKQVYFPVQEKKIEVDKIDIFDILGDEDD